VHFIGSVLNKIFHVLMFPFRDADATWGLLWISLLTAVAALLVYRFFSEQTAIRQVKGRLKAHILEMRLFQHDPILMGRAVLSVLKSNARYLRLNLKPFFFMFLPVVLILIQMDARYGYRPLQPGESALIRTFWTTGAEAQADPSGPLLAVSSGLDLETPALRIHGLGEVDWRVRATEEGGSSLRIRSGGQDVRIPVEVSRRILPVSPWNGRKSSPKMLWNPAAHPVPASGDLLSVEIDYPRRDFRFFGVPVSWIWPYFLLSLMAGYLMKGVARVEI